MARGSNKMTMKLFLPSQALPWQVQRVSSQPPCYRTAPRCMKRLQWKAPQSYSKNFVITVTFPNLAAYLYKTAMMKYIFLSLLMVKVSCAGISCWRRSVGVWGSSRLNQPTPRLCFLKEPSEFWSRAYHLKKNYFIIFWRFSTLIIPIANKAIIKSNKTWDISPPI